MKHLIILEDSKNKVHEFNLVFRTEVAKIMRHSKGLIKHPEWAPDKLESYMKTIHESCIKLDKLNDEYTIKAKIE